MPAALHVQLVLFCSSWGLFSNANPSHHTPSCSSAAPSASIIRVDNRGCFAGTMHHPLSISILEGQCFLQRPGATVCPSPDHPWDWNSYLHWGLSMRYIVHVCNSYCESHGCKLGSMVINVGQDIPFLRLCWLGAIFRPTFASATSHPG